MCSVLSSKRNPGIFWIFFDVKTQIPIFYRAQFHHCTFVIPAFLSSSGFPAVHSNLRRNHVNYFTFHRAAYPRACAHQQKRKCTYPSPSAYHDVVLTRLETKSVSQSVSHCVAATDHPLDRPSSVIFLSFRGSCYVQSFAGLPLSRPWRRRCRTCRWVRRNKVSKTCSVRVVPNCNMSSCYCFGLFYSYFRVSVRRVRGEWLRGNVKKKHVSREFREMMCKRNPEVSPNSVLQHTETSLIRVIFTFSLQLLQQNIQRTEA